MKALARWLLAALYAVYVATPARMLGFSDLGQRRLTYALWYVRNRRTIRRRLEGVSR